MEDKLHIVVMSAKTKEEIKRCALLQRQIFSILVRKYPVTYSQILFPYADERNVFTADELSEKPLFGTHAIFCNIEKKWLSQAISEAQTAFEEQYTEKAPDTRIRSTDRCKRSIIYSLRSSKISGVLSCGCFSKLIASSCECWQIRDAARKFASFADIVETKSGGAVCGISGGKLIIDTTKDFSAEADRLYFLKTGESAETRYFE